METKRQREFKKQIKSLEKEGKIPDNYYARRKYKKTGSWISVLVVLFFLWRFGVFSLIFVGINNVINPRNISEENEMNISQEYNDDSQNNGQTNDIYTKIYDYQQKNAEVEILIADINIDVYKNFYTDNKIDVVKIDSYYEKIENALLNVESDEMILKSVIENYKENLNISKDILDFTKKNIDKELNETDKIYLEALFKKTTEIKNKRDTMFIEFFENN